MPITPQTNIFLLKCPLTLSNTNQLTFQSKQAQFNYFSNLEKLKVENSQYQRKDNIIRFPAHIDSIIEFNYCMYQNDNYLNKFFYAYITNMRYINDNMTEITIETDTFQTWQFDLTYKPSFIEREHVEDDTIGLHTLNENLSVGEVVEEEEQEDISLSQNMFIAIMSNWNPSTKTQWQGISVYNKQIFGNQVHLIRYNNANDAQAFYGYILATNNDGHIEDIKDVFIIPSGLITESSLIENEFEANSSTFTFYTLLFSDSPATFTNNISKLTAFSDFTPKNNKCFVYPYNYLMLTNNCGNYNLFKYENFTTSNCQFRTDLAMSVGCSGRIVPLNYRNKLEDEDESIALGKFPTCAWSADSYVNWLTQNAINLPMKIFNTIVSNVSSGLSLATSTNLVSDTINTTMNSANQIASVIDDFYEASLLSNIEAPQNVNDVNWASR